MRHRLTNLLRHSVVYGVASLVSRIASVLLLPVLSRELGPNGYGRIETLVALTALLVPLLRAGVATAFFRFAFERTLAPDPAEVVRTSFWFSAAGAVGGGLLGALAAPLIARALLDAPGQAGLVRAAFLVLFGQILYEQMTALYRIEERSTAYAVAGLANLAITVAATLLLVLVAGLGATGALLGNAAGTLAVLAVLVWLRRSELRFGYDRDLVRRMNAFGLPLLPTGLALWVIDFSDRLLLGQIADQRAVGIYAVGVKIASAMILVQLAFRTAWPAFAYSIEDDAEARRAFALVLVYIAFVGSWVSVALGVLAPWLVRWLATEPFQPAERVVAPLAFSAALLTAYTMLQIGAARSNRTERFWLIALAGAAVNIVGNLALIPRFGVAGAASATVAAYAVLAGAMAWWSQRIYPVPHQWRRVATATGTGVVLCVAGRAADLPLAGAIAIAAAYPLVLVPLRFYLASERRYLVSLAARMRR